MKFRLVCVSALVGVGAGLGGMTLALLLRAVQHLSYGYSPGMLIGPESFLQGVEAASPERRVLVLILLGVIAGLGWWLIGRFGKPLVSISDAVAARKTMPVLTTLSHIFLQIIAVAMGSPMGREVAPRELGTLIAQRFSSQAGLSPRDTQIMLACGAGAGLAAVYNVPFAGAVFVLEVILREFSLGLLIRAVAISGIAVIVSWIGLGNHPAYQVPHLAISNSLIVWSLITGPIFGFLGHWFERAANYARSKAQTNWQTPVLCLLNFTLLGLLAIYFPALLGNGKSPAQLEFNDAIGLGLTAILLLLRVFFVCSTLRSGTHGGLLTPSLANGALLAVLLGGLWQLLWPGPALNTFAIVGATAFLASAQKMPVTAVILIFEFTRVNPSFLIPIILAVTGAYLATLNRRSNSV